MRRESITATAIELLKNYKFDEPRVISMIHKVPISVCALITPWNWPMSTVITKVIPALATGCTMILKPSEYSSFSAQVLTEILHDAKAPAGVFNLVCSDGPTVGTALSGHPDLDMVSITGSTRAGIEVARNAAATVKRVHQELGGKSPLQRCRSAHVCLVAGGFGGRPLKQTYQLGAQNWRRAFPQLPSDKQGLTRVHHLWPK